MKKKSGLFEYSLTFFLLGVLYVKIMLYLVFLYVKIYSSAETGKLSHQKNLATLAHPHTLSGTETMGVKEDGVKEEEEAVDLGRVMLGGALRSSIR